jgi:hypothetical protein
MNSETGFQVQSMKHRHSLFFFFERGGGGIFVPFYGLCPHQERKRKHHPIKDLRAEFELGESSSTSVVPDSGEKLGSPER